MKNQVVDFLARRLLCSDPSNGTINEGFHFEQYSEIRCTHYDKRYSGTGGLELRRSGRVHGRIDF